MFIFDVETLGIHSDAVVLSAAILHVDIDKKNTIETLINDALFIKFSVDDQVKKYKRIIQKETLEWWGNQSLEVKLVSFTPNPSKDVTVIDGISKIKSYIKKYGNQNSLIWTRGNLDSIIIDSLCNNIKEKPILPYRNYRDIRTYIDLMHETSKCGYSDIDTELYPNFDSSRIMKHDPRYDCVYDALMMLYGK